jgi:hypothetical protein
MAAMAVAAACAGGDGSSSTTSGTGESTTTVAPTTTLSPEELAARDYETDVALITDLWTGLSDAWSAAPADAIDFMVGHNYPEMGTPDECRAVLEAAYGGQPPGYREEHVVDEAGIERDDSWVIPSLAVTPIGRTYRVTTLSTYTAPGADPVERTIEAHTTIRDGEAFLFVPCS